MEYVNLSDVQGNILLGYNLKFVRHIVVRVADPAAARKFLDSVISDSDLVPQLTTAKVWERKPTTCLNVGVTATGLRALGLDEASVKTFPLEFLEGAAARAVKVGDVDESAPEHWADGLDRADNVHLMWTVHGCTETDRDQVAAAIEAIWAESRAFTVTSRLDGAALPDFDDHHVEVAGHTRVLGDKVHFGYRDSIAQPRFEVNGTVIGKKDAQPTTPIGAILLGYTETSFPDVSWQMPSPPELGRNGCFNAFRVLQQDVDGFEEFLNKTADDLKLNKELVAAKLMGRWRNGVPLALSHEVDHLDRDSGMPTEVSDEQLNDFDYLNASKGNHDLMGRQCPIGSHIRRANPRGGRMVQRSANYTRPIIRRGMPYGPVYDPHQPRDGQRRGLLGSFICASLIAQFEAIMYDWINLGLHDPRITGTNDPIIGANKVETSRFEFRVGANQKSDPIVLKGFPRFTHTVAGIYLFCPSVTALRKLSALPAA